MFEDYDDDAPDWSDVDEDEEEEQEHGRNCDCDRCDPPHWLAGQ